MDTIPDILWLPDKIAPAKLSHLSFDELHEASRLSVVTTRETVSLYIVDPAERLVLCQGGAAESGFELHRVATYLGACIGSTTTNPRAIRSGLGMQFESQDGSRILLTAPVEVRGISRILHPLAPEVLRLAKWSYEAQLRADDYLPVIAEMVADLPLHLRDPVCQFLEVFSPVGRILLTELFRGAHEAGCLKRTLELLYHQCLQHWEHVEAARRGELRTIRDRNVAARIFDFAGVSFPPELRSVKG